VTNAIEIRVVRAKDWSWVVLQQKHTIEVGNEIDI